MAARRVVARSSLGLRLLALLALVVVPMAPRVARAQVPPRAAPAKPAAPRGAPPRTASLSWVRPPEADACFSTRSLAQAVDDRLGRRVVVSASEADLSVEASVVPIAEPAGWKATVVLRDAAGRSLGTREISSDGPSCEALRAPLAVVIAVLVDPEASLAPRKPAAIAPAPTPTPPPAAPCPPSPPPPVWRIGVWAGPTAGIGVLPDPAVGLTVGARVTPPHFWGIEVTGAWWKEQSLDAEQGAVVDFALAWGTLALCPIRFGGRGPTFEACAGARLGSLRAIPGGFDAQAAHEQWVVDVITGGHLGVPLVAPLTLEAGVTLAAATTRDEVLYQQPSGGERSLFRPAPVSATGDIALGVRFP